MEISGVWYFGMTPVNLFFLAYSWSYVVADVTSSEILGTSNSATSELMAALNLALIANGLSDQSSNIISVSLTDVGTSTSVTYELNESLQNPNQISGTFGDQLLTEMKQQPELSELWSKKKNRSSFVLVGNEVGKDRSLLKIWGHSVQNWFFIRRWAFPPPPPKKKNQQLRCI